MYHPLCFTNDIPLDRPVAIKTFQKQLVLWRTLQRPNVILCSEDRCPHRNAQLSKGMVTGDGTLQCGYHGWEFGATGECVRIPQLKKGQCVPRSCRLNTTYQTKNIHQVLYIESVPKLHTQTLPLTIPQTNGIHQDGHIDPNEAFTTDYLLEANYDFWIQMENLMDPAHIHFVHNGFQGDMTKAKFIRVVSMVESEWRIQAEFTHDDRLIPDIRITFDAPGTIDVCILGPTGETVRRNIIYVTPIEPGKCRVLFRDVAYKKYLVPDGWVYTRMLLGTDWIEDGYQRINQAVVDSIMEQDISILESQQKGMDSRGTLEDYLAAREILLTESDQMIVAFRRWCRKHAEWLNTHGYA